jgi:predicted DNA-binding transcriptional regulator AlpA
MFAVDTREPRQTAEEEIAMTVFDIESLAQTLRTDESTVLAFVEAGVLPSPVVIDGRLVRWSGEAIEEWLRAGCPTSEAPRSTWFCRMRLAWHRESLDRSSRAAAMRDEIVAMCDAAAPTAN